MVFAYLIRAISWRIFVRFGVIILVKNACARSSLCSLTALSDAVPHAVLNRCSAQLGGDLEFLAGTFSADKKKTAMALVRGIQVRLCRKP